MASSYRIIDEPAPGALSKYVVDPLWPLLGFMLLGSWLSIPWYIFNGVAMGSPTLRREIFWCVISIAGSVGIVMVLDAYYSLDHDNTGQLKYLLLVLLVWKLGVSYVLYMLQSHTFELYRYYGGVVRNGFLFLIVVFIFRRAITTFLYANTYVMLMVR